MEQLLTSLHGAGISELIVFGFVVNFGIYFCSLGLYTVLSSLPGAQHMGDKQPILRSDVLLSLLTVVCNTIVFILGVLLWRSGWITLAGNRHWLSIAAEVLFLIFAMDLLMYVFHRAVHFLRYFRNVHERHHSHTSTNMLSLFVLHPIESIGFGLMMLGVICLFPCTAIGISAYLLIN